MKKNIAVVFAVLLFISVGLQTKAEAAEFSGVRRNLATIIFCGLGGAVIGISTLSFYGDPENHVGNITTGLALGTLAGVAYVTTRAATQKTTGLDLHDRMFEKKWAQSSPPLLKYEFTF